MHLATILPVLVLLCHSANALPLQKRATQTLINTSTHITTVDQVTTIYENEDDVASAADYSSANTAIVDKAIDTSNIIQEVANPTGSGMAIGVSKAAAASAASAITSATTANTGAAAAAAATTATSKATSTATSKATSKASKATSATSRQSSSSATASSYPKAIGNIGGDLKDFEEPTKEFKDGTIKCSDFPSGQGVIKLPWIGRSGWASVTNYDTGDTATTCKEGWLCSYACQPGMLKTQWPSTQPASGESRGGLLCKNGYLYRTRTEKKYLCEWGTKTNFAVLKLDKVLSLCRTDYPGSENMNIPTRLIKGDKKPMSVIKEDGYYTWKGGKTSSQYYVNNAGVDVDKGCLWGNSSGTVGNWAPVVLGSGYTDGKTWLSIIPNPNNENPPNYNIKIEAEGNAKVSGDCWYVDGQYSGGPGLKSDGCTSAVTGGTANFVFYPRSK